MGMGEGGGRRGEGGGGEESLRPAGIGPDRRLSSWRLHRDAPQLTAHLGTHSHKPVI